MSGGWIKLHRDIKEHWVWNDPLLLKIWLDILLTANHKDNKILIDGKMVTIKRGQFFTSKTKLADRWKMDRKTVTKKLNLLQSDGMIFVTSFTKVGTLIEVRNYGKFQQFSDGPSPNESPNEYPNESPNASRLTPHKQECKRMNKNDKEVFTAPPGGYDV